MMQLNRRNWGSFAGASIAAVATSAFSAEVGNLVDRNTISIFDFLNLEQRSNIINRLGTLDLSSAIQAAIDSIGRSTGSIRRGSITFPSGAYALERQIEVNQQSIRFIGEGSTEWRWIGDENSHMMRIVDSSRCEWTNLTILGNDSHPPLSAIYFDEPTSSKIGTNEYHTLRNVAFGRRWTQDLTSAGKLQVGLRIGGASNTNNDSFYLDNVQFHDCIDRGMSVENAQSIWGNLSNVTFNACGVGLYSGSNISANNICFNRSKVRDMEFFRDILVNIHVVNSENSAQFCKLSQDASLFIDGGKVLVGALHKSPQWLDIASGNFLTLRNFQAVQVATSLKQIRYISSSRSRGSIFIAQCRLPGGDDGSGFDFIKPLGSKGFSIHVEHGPFSKRVADL